MRLWLEWWKIVLQLRDACSRHRTFLWLGVALAGFTIRVDLLGVTSIIRALGLLECNYDRLLDFFHSKALSTQKLTQVWINIALKYLPLLKRNGRIVLVGDGIKIPKSGKKMPAVKKLFQESESNTKPSYIFGHSYQAVGVLAGIMPSIFAVPLISRIHEGIILSNRDKRTLMDKMVKLLISITSQYPYYFVADSYYACKTIIHGVLRNGNHLVSRVKTNAVAYESANPQKHKGKRGRKRKYGRKIKLFELFNNVEIMEEAQSPLHDDKGTMIRFLVQDLIWRRAAVMVRFVAVIHPTKGKILLMCTDLSLSAVEIIELYGLRFKIELSFKQAVREIGAYSYHFWMKNMKKIKRSGKNQYLHKNTEKYRKAVLRKIEAYHRFVQIGIIAQGLLQYLACCHTKLVWNSFGSWIRTIRPGILPSEMVTSIAMRNTFPEFLAGSNEKVNLTKFIVERIDIARTEGARLVA